MVRSEIKIPEERKLANFEQTAEHYIAELNSKQEGRITADEELEIELFAKYLDSFSTLSEQLRLVAIEETLKVYLEFYDIFKKNAPAEVQEKCLKILQKNHKHTK